jgi:hypothetical protein
MDLLKYGNFHSNYTNGNSPKLEAQGLFGKAWIGEAVSMGDVLIFDEPSNAFLKAIGDGSQSPACVLALQDGTGGNSIRALLGGTCQVDGWNFNGPIYLSPTSAGSFTTTKPTTAGQVIQPLGLATGDRIIFKAEFKTTVVPG